MQLTTFRPGMLLVGVLALVSALSLASASDYSNAVTASAPIAWYRMDDASDSADSHDGTATFLEVTFAEPTPIANDPGMAAQFSGAGEIFVWNDPDFHFGQMTDFSIETWVKKSSDGTVATILNKGDTNAGYWLRFQSDGTLRFLLDYGPKSAGSPFAEAWTTTPYDDGEWHHVVGVAKRGEGVKLYVDYTDVTVGAEYGAGDVSSTLPATIGLLNPDIPVQFFPGSMDEVAVYDSALSGAQIAAHYNSGLSGFGGVYDSIVGADAPIGWWRMADASDSGSGNHTSTAGSTIAFGQPTGIYGDAPPSGTGAAVLDGTVDSHILIDDAPDLSFGTEGDFTVEAWVNLTFPGIDPEFSDKVMILNKGDTDGSYWLRLEKDGTPRFLLDFGSVALAAQGSEAVVDGTWHHLVGVANRDLGVQLYVDGVLVDEATSGGDVSSELDLYIGQNGANGNYMAGSMDELAIYDHALTGAEVLAHYLAAGYSVAQIPGDASGNGFVDEGDAAILAQNWGSSGPEIGWGQGDFNGDNTVDVADASIMAANWNAGSAEAARAVPEPTTLVGLLGMALAVAIGRRARRNV